MKRPLTDRTRALLVMTAFAVVFIFSALITSSAQATTHTVWTWGQNSLGELGNGLTTEAKTPVSVFGFATAVAGGYDHSLALRSGRVYAWGADQDGQLGTPSGASMCGATPCLRLPHVVGRLSAVVAIAAGVNFSLALLSNGTVMSWGDNDFGELGTGSQFGPTNCGGPNCSLKPVAVTGLSNVKAIAAGGHHALALLGNGTVMAWGDNGSGQLGIGTSAGPETCGSGAACSPTPVLVATPSGGPLTHVEAIAAGDAFSLALVQYSVSEVQAWGTNVLGQLGQGTVVGPDRCAGGSACSTRPVMVTSLSGTETAIAANGNADQALALEPNGTVAAWGGNHHHELGSGCTTVVCSSPALIPGITDATAIAASAGPNTARSMALEAGGQAVEWGGTLLGNGTDFPMESATPVKVTGMSAASGIAAGGVQSLALAPPPRSRFGLVLFNCLCSLVRLNAHLPGPGVLLIHQLHTPSPGPVLIDARAKTTLVRPVIVTVKKAGVVKIGLRLTRAGKRVLSHRHKLRVKVRITFTPMGGQTAGRTVAVTFRAH